MPTITKLSRRMSFIVSSNLKRVKGLFGTTSSKQNKVELSMTKRSVASLLDTRLECSAETMGLLRVVIDCSTTSDTLCGTTHTPTDLSRTKRQRE